MRLLEIVIPVLLGVYLVWPRPRLLGVRLAPALALAATVLHLIFEGYRWQMVPLYVLTLVLAVLSLRANSKPKEGFAWGTILASVMLVIAIALPVVLPVPVIGAPSGPYQVGTTFFEMTDTSRSEIYSGIAGEPRRFMIQAWYPAAVTSADVLAPWIQDADVYTPAISTMLDLPPFFLDHLALTKTPAYVSPQIAESAGPFPLIIFSHGWKGFSAASTGQASELASQGYVVIALQHTYGAITTVFPDGTVAPINPKALPAEEDDPNYEVIARRLVAQWAGDISFVVDQLESSSGEAGSFFAGMVDLSRIGVYGHSTGGGAAIQFCGTDPRCKVVLGMDPWMRPVSAEVIAAGVRQPAFFMFSEEWAEVVGDRNKNNLLLDQFLPNNSDSRGVVELLGTAHLDFSDLPLLSPIAPLLGLKGPLNGQRVIEIVNAYLVDFFGMTLMDRPSALFEGEFDDFVEVRVFK